MSVELCKKCIHFERCKFLIGITGEEDSCDWTPSRFRENKN